MRLVATACFVALVTSAGSSQAQVPDAYLHDSYYAVPSAPMVARAAAAVGLPPLGAGEVLLEVDGDGSVRTRADLVTLLVPVTSTAATAAAARSANAQLAARLSAAARSAGVAEADIQLVDPAGALGFIGNEFAGAMMAAEAAAQPKQSVRRSLEIRIRTPSNFPRVRDALEEAGANAVVEPTYALSDSRVARQGAKAQAVSNARADADSYARSLNMRVGRILRVSDRAGFNPYDPSTLQDMFRKASGMGNGSSDEVVTTARVSVDFALVPDR